MCSETLCDDAMRPSKLYKNLQTKHKDLVKKLLEYFERMCKNLQKQVISIKKMKIEGQSSLKITYLVALQITKNEKPYIIKEYLIKPCMLMAREENLEKHAIKKL